MKNQQNETYSDNPEPFLMSQEIKNNYSGEQDYG
jgi:hypothetical protein